MNLQQEAIHRLEFGTGLYKPGETLPYPALLQPMLCSEF